METYLFAWNPNKWPWDNLLRALDQIAATGYTSEWWSCQSHKSIRPDDRAFLVRVGVEPKGIMASGYIVTEPFLFPHWSCEDKMVNCVDIKFDTLIDPASGNMLSLEQLDNPPLNMQTWTPQASGISISPDVAVELERVWYEHVEGLGIVSRETPTGTPPQSFLEGLKRQVSSTRYERNPHARRLCIEHYGTECVICGIDFGAAYGKLGEGFIHVHHLSPVALSDEPQSVDPIKDLRPVCPNCHAMLHRKSPPISIEALREMLE